MVIAQCSAGPDPLPPLQTHILEVRVEPNPVAVGDTATFTCIIEDSLDERFRFGWSIQGDDKLGDTVTNENIFKWKAPNEIGVYNHSVEAFNGTDPDSIPAARSFTIEVIENQ